MSRDERTVLREAIGRAVRETGKSLADLSMDEVAELGDRMLFLLATDKRVILKSKERESDSGSRHRSL